MSTKSEPLPLAVDFRKAAELTSLSSSTLRRLAKSGRLRTVVLGRRRVVPMESLTDLIKNGSAAADGQG